MPRGDSGPAAPGRAPWRRRLLRRAGGALGAGILALSGRSLRLRVTGEETAEHALSRHGAVIFAVWHGRMWVPIARLRQYDAAVLVSLSEDGEVIARAAARLGFHPVRGSSSRRGRESLAELGDLLAGGRTVALTPDGPRGPRHVAQMGAVALAARSGKPIVPLGAAAAPCWTLRSWDRFQIPAPAARAHVVYGSPFLVPPSEDLDPWRLHLQACLTALEEAAEREIRR